jgi:hypothetical protein
MYSGSGSKTLLFKCPELVPQILSFKIMKLSIINKKS